MIRRYIEVICDNCKEKMSFAVKEKDRQIDEEFMRQEEEKLRRIYEEESAEFARMNGD